MNYPPPGPRILNGLFKKYVLGQGLDMELDRIFNDIVWWPLGRALRHATTHRYPASRTAIGDHRRANLTVGGHGLRAAKGTPHQPLDGGRNCPGTNAPWDYPAHFSTTRVSSVKKGDLKPHLIRYWLTPPADPGREESILAICQVYQQAPQLAGQGERIMSTDELTGVQALKRKHP